MKSIYIERFNLTLQHRPVDRCPFDLGGTPQSTIEDGRLVVRLAKHLGFHGLAPKDYGKFDRRILEHFDVDFRRAGNLIGFATKRNKRISDTESIDAYGIRRRFSGIYWDIVRRPLANATADDVAGYEFPRVDQMKADIDAWASEAEILYRDTPFVVIGEHPVFGVLELACWLCGYDHIMTMLALDPEFIHTLFAKILAFQKEIIREYYSRIGRFIHVTTSGDDFGTQTGPFMSPQMWRAFVKPYLKERIEYTAKFTDARYLHHTCGAVYPLIPQLIDAGVDILNPLQPGAKDMQPEKLKAAFGGRLTFWGGIDTQHVLPEGTPADVTRAVRRVLDAMAENGGYVLAPAHNIQADVPAENVAAIYAAGRNYFRT